MISISCVNGNLRRAISKALAQGFVVQGISVSADGRSATIEDGEDLDDFLDILEAAGCSWESDEQELYRGKKLNAPRLIESGAPSAPGRVPKIASLSWGKPKEKPHKYPKWRG